MKPSCKMEGWIKDYMYKRGTDRGRELEET